MVLIMLYEVFYIIMLASSSMPSSVFRMHIINLVVHDDWMICNVQFLERNTVSKVLFDEKYEIPPICQYRTYSPE